MVPLGIVVGVFLKENLCYPVLVGIKWLVWIVMRNIELYFGRGP